MEGHYPPEAWGQTCGVCQLLGGDVHGSQQYIPLLRVKVPPEMVEQLLQVQL